MRVRALRLSGVSVMMVAAVLAMSSVALAPAAADETDETVVVAPQEASPSPANETEGAAGDSSPEPSAPTTATTSSDPSAPQSETPDPPPGEDPPPAEHVCVPPAKHAGWRSTWQPPTGAVFNHPRGTTAARWRIVRTVNAAVNNAWPCSQVWMTLYLMDHRPTVDALIAARNRGVQVRVVLDNDHANNAMTQRLARALNGDNGKPDPRQPAAGPLKWGPDGSFVKFCAGSCRGGYGVNHSKFYVFSRTGRAANVAMVSSSNLNHGGANLGWNDMYVLRSAALVNNARAGFARIHDEMAQDRNLGADRYRTMTSGAFTTRFFPTFDGADPVYADLGRIKCRYGASGRTRVNISMFQWMHGRGIKFAKRVIALGRAGCDVRVLYGAPGAEVRKRLNTAARNKRIMVWNTRFDKNRDGKPDYRVHHKYVAINGMYAGQVSRRVLTGTQNWSGNSTRGTDENTLTVVSGAAHKQYMNNWNLIRSKWAVRIR
jgi:phosphatidylserine/phosphatidylglycerophosphate/cardiolipin synthase-like enzyme